MRDRTLQLQKESSIKAEFATWQKKRKFTREYICQQLSSQFHLAPTTIERIVAGEYDANRRRVAERAAARTGISATAR